MVKTNKLTEERITKKKASADSNETKEQLAKDAKKKQVAREEKATVTAVDDLRSSGTEEDKIKPFLCEPCRAKKTRKDAIGFCDTCLDFLCADCIETHKRGRILRTHVHNILERIERPVEPDTENVTQEVCKCMSGFVKFYCKDHKCLLCKTCKMYTHKRCHVSSILDVADDFVDSRQFKNEVKELQGIRNKCEKQRKACQTEINKISITFSGILDEIKQIRRSLTDAIDKFEDAIKRDLNRLFAKEEKLIRDKKVKFELLMSTADKKINSVEKLKAESNDVEIFVSFHKSVGQTRKLQESLKSIQKDAEELEVTFTKNSIIDMFLQTEKLGELKVGKVTKAEPQKEIKPLWDKRRLLWSPDRISEESASDRTKPKSETFMTKSKVNDGFKSAPATDVRNRLKKSVKIEAPKAIGGDHKKPALIPPIKQYTSKRSSHLHVKRKAVMENYRLNQGAFY